MKKLVFLFLLCILACKESPNKSPQKTFFSPEKELQSGFIEKDRSLNKKGATVKDGVQTEKSTEILFDGDSSEWEGTYKKITDEKDCNCNFFTLSFSQTHTLCLVPEKINIKVRFEKADSTSLSMFLVTPEKEENVEESLPWEKFDTHTPIANLETLVDGALKLDWKGFSIDKKLAVDYALLGKKTMEGTYKKI